MATVLLVRHGRTTANDAGVLAGWLDDVALDEAGREQVARQAQRLLGLPLAAVVSSPLQRCRETTDLLLAGREVERHEDERLGEVRYGEWQGRTLKELAKEPLWKVVQAHPSAVTFPGTSSSGRSPGEGGESLRDMQFRAVSGIRDWNARLGDDAVYAVVSHGDVIKAVLADALGLHLDHFQRIVVDPASVSVITYTPLRPFVVRLNDVGGDFNAFAPRPRRGRGRSAGKGRRGGSLSDAVPGGGAGSSA